MKKELTICVMCNETADLMLQGKNLINAALCLDCGEKIQDLIEHCDLDWSFSLGVNR